MALKESSTPFIRVVQQPLQLMPGVELIVGINNASLLYIPVQKKYIHLSSLGAEVIRLFVGGQILTADDIALLLLEYYPGRGDEIEQKVAAFLQQLAAMGSVFHPTENDSERKPKTNTPHPFSIKTSRPMLRLGIWHPKRPVAERVVNQIREAGLGKSIGTMLGFWVALAIVLAGYSLIHMGIGFNWGLTIWPLVIGCLLLHIIGHELCHALVGSYYGVKDREIGVGLLYYVFPVAYVDRTDSYRLRNKRHHALISLAGPAWDISVATISAVIAMVAIGATKASFHLLLFIQISLFISNLNPFMPSDGYRALEAIAGGLNFRRRAFIYFFYVIRRKNLPSHLKEISFRQKCFYFFYGFYALSLAMIAIIDFVGFVIVNAITILMRIGGHA